MTAFRHAGFGFGHRLLAGGGVLWISKEPEARKSLRVDQKVKLSELRARDRLRHRRILQDGIIDFPIEGSSEIVPCRLISSNTVAMVFQLQVHLFRRRICVTLVTRLLCVNARLSIAVNL